MYDEEDGRCVGEALCMARKEGPVEDMFETWRGLKEMAAKHAFVRVMLLALVENRLHIAHDVSSKLCNLSEKEGRTLGSSLAMSIASNVTAEAGVDEWVVKCGALRELDATEAWFR